ncbi:MAG: D-lyxose/D-mannose family sugar isomerase [Chloroflexi bacterium]|nr:D-lyxose/D-mannose family sugar isomerase [Chloroflexota bacterium]
MKRSEINAIIRDADAFLRAQQFHLPPFAYWSPADWATKGEEVREIVDRELGWDITDFGSGNYADTGLFIFTIRNSDPSPDRAIKNRLYAEKVLICDPNQKTPLHYHWFKCEDIINRGGGTLVVKCYNATDDDAFDESTPVSVNIDGTQKTFAPGELLRLQPGESITITNRLYHTFWGEGSRVLVGEVSQANNDNTDNRFYTPVGRFPQIDEDEEPLYLLCKDYPRYYRP